MKPFNKRFITPLFAVLAMFAVAMFSGCSDDKPEVITDRSKDKAYQQDLVESRKEQQKIAVRNADITMQMQRLIERARKALPAGATDEQVKAELDNNPKKYPAWKALYERSLDNKAKVEKSLADARAKVRERIQREKAAKESVKNGRAKAAAAK